MVVGCSLLIAADALREVGPFDEAYFAYHEDVDWCFRVRDAGWEVHYQPLSRVYHAGSRSTAALVQPLARSRDRGGRACRTPASCRGIPSAPTSAPATPSAS